MTHHRKLECNCFQDQLVMAKVQNFIEPLYILPLNDNNDNEILIKREPLVYTRARRAVQKEKARTVQQQ